MLIIPSYTHIGKYMYEIWRFLLLWILAVMVNISMHIYTWNMSMENDTFIRSQFCHSYKLFLDHLIFSRSVDTMTCGIITYILLHSWREINQNYIVTFSFALPVAGRYFSLSITFMLKNISMKTVCSFCCGYEKRY